MAAISAASAQIAALPFWSSLAAQRSSSSRDSNTAGQSPRLSRRSRSSLLASSELASSAMALRKHSAASSGRASSPARIRPRRVRSRARSMGLRVLSSAIPSSSSHSAVRPICSASCIARPSARTWPGSIWRTRRRCRRASPGRDSEPSSSVASSIRIGTSSVPPIRESSASSSCTRGSVSPRRRYMSRNALGALRSSGRSASTCRYDPAAEARSPRLRRASPIRRYQSLRSRASSQVTAARSQSWIRSPSRPARW